MHSQPFFGRAEVGLRQGCPHTYGPPGFSLLISGIIVVYNHTLLDIKLRALYLPGNQSAN